MSLIEKREITPSTQSESRASQCSLGEEEGEELAEGEDLPGAVAGDQEGIGGAGDGGALQAQLGGDEPGPQLMIAVGDHHQLGAEALFLDKL